jgi:hypothetical protein
VVAAEQRPGGNTGTVLRLVSAASSSSPRSRSVSFRWFEMGDGAAAGPKEREGERRRGGGVYGVVSEAGGSLSVGCRSDGQEGAPHERSMGPRVSGTGSAGWGHGVSGSVSRVRMHLLPLGARIDMTSGPSL